MPRSSTACLLVAAVSLFVPFAAQAQAPALPQGPGRDVVEAVCTGCHQTNMITQSSGYTHDGWKELIGTMIDLSRSPETQSIAAAGLNFQIPSGPAKVYQDTGTLSLVPYVTGAQNFLRSSYGSFNVMAATTGRCMNVRGGSTSQGAPIEVDDCVAGWSSEQFNIQASFFTSSGSAIGFPHGGPF